MERRNKWLWRAGFITGIAGMTEIIIWGFLHTDNSLSGTILDLSIYIVPFIFCLLISWKWPLIGGIILVIIAVFWLALVSTAYFSTPSTNPVLELFYFIFQRFLIISLPYLIPGIFFVLYGVNKRKRQSPVRP